MIEATPVDQRTGRAISLNSIPPAFQLTQQHKEQIEGEQRERDELIAHLEQGLAPQVTSRAGAVDARRLNSLVQAELARLALLPGGYASALMSLRSTEQASKSQNLKTREKELAAEQKAATLEANDLLAEVVSRSAWLYRNVLATKAVEIRLQQAVDHLTAIEGNNHLGIELGRWVRLPGECVGVAGQQMRILGIGVSEAFLPEIDPSLKLPEEFQQPTTASSHTDQPRDHASRMVAGAVPAERNPDGTLRSVSGPNAFVGNSGVAVPRTEAQDRAARRKVAAEISKEDGAR
jgi:hypothetical protein